MSEELKPCPFCGESNTLFVEHDVSYYVVCNLCNYGCGTTAPVVRSEQEAIEAWNRRYNNA